MKRKLFFLSALILVLLFSCGAWLLHKQPRPDLTIIGFVNMADGIGRQSAELADALKDDISFNFIKTRITVKKDLSSRVRKILHNKTMQIGKVVLFEDLVWRPDGENYKLKTPKNDDQIRIAYSMFEATKIPSEWVILLNTYFDAVAVPDVFLIEVYRNSGVDIPIFEVPLGLDLSPFLNAPLKTKIKSPKIFANFGTCIPRKNHLTLVKAFSKAFGNSKDVRLIINSRYCHKETKNAVSKYIADSNCKNIIFSTLCLEKSAYLSLFQTVDCYVSISKAEGFSIQPREAMALGIPVIVTTNTAQTTIANSNLVKSVSSPFEEPALFYWDEIVGTDFNCDVDEVAAALRDVYENYDQYLQNAPAARAWARQYQFENLKDYYISLVKPKRVILGDEDKIGPDFLMTTSKELYEKYRKLIIHDDL